MGYNNEIQISRPNVTEILSKMRAGDYYVDNSFQRRLVWNDKQKVRLIETVLMDFPMPEIYLWEQAPNVETGTQKFSIVDGQQRLSSLREFASNEWPLKKAFLDEGHHDEPYVDCYWKDLSADLRTHIFQYIINVRRIPSAVPEDDIRVIFARLNETDRSLNPQEMRNATLNGEFLNAALEIADSDVMQSLGIFTVDNIRRMGDVEFASQLLGYERKGIDSDTPKSMNELYDDFNSAYPDAVQDISKITKSLRKIGRLFEDESVRSFFQTQNYVYTLHTLLDTFDVLSDKQLLLALSAFAADYNSVVGRDEDQAEIDPNLAEFREGAISRTKSKTSRTQRLFGLKKWIEARVDNFL